ncbi:hypothetical protein LCGC14_2485490, partial [marine sediment metagenome]
MVALLIQSAGGAASGYVPLVMVPIFWLALYGTRSELAAAITAAASMFVAPLVFLGNRALPETDLREALLWMAVAMVVGFTAQRLVRTIREKAAESARREEARRESEERLNTVVETMSDGLIVAGPKGELVIHNRAAGRILGTGARAVGSSGGQTGLDIYQSDGVTPVPEEEQPLARAIEGETVQDVEMFVRNQRVPDGAWISVSAAPLKGAEGASGGGVAVFRDITERKRAEQEADRLKDEFFALVSHELRTPLTSIVGYLELLED